MLEMLLGRIRVEKRGGLEVGRLEVERGSGRMNVTRPAWISERCGVDVHVRWAGRFIVVDG